MRAVMLDTQGPEIRTGKFADGVKGIELETDDRIVVTTDDELKLSQTKNKIWISYPSLLSSVEKNESAKEATCVVKNNGRLGSKKGVNLPGISVDFPAMC